jgi:hypothetical protein
MHAQSARDYQDAVQDATGRYRGDIPSADIALHSRSPDDPSEEIRLAITSSRTYLRRIKRDVTGFHITEARRVSDGWAVTWSPLDAHSDKRPFTVLVSDDGHIGLATKA